MMSAGRNALVAALLLLIPLLLSADAAEEAAAPLQVPLKRHLRVLIRPTLLGLLPPADPQGYGEAFVRVTSVVDGSINLRYEIKEEIGGAERPNDRVTRIRRGAIVVSGFRSAQGIHAPLFWGDDDWQTDTALLWVSQAVFAALRDTDSAEWDPDPTGLRETAQAQAIRERIAELRGQAELGAEEPVQLVVTDAEAAYPVKLNGERLQIPAFKAADSLGLAEYWILDDPANPLVLKMGFIPPANGAEDLADSLDLVAAGAGYALAEINF